MVKISRSGHPDALTTLTELADNPDFYNSRDFILQQIDEWRQKQAARAWKPISPEGVIDYLEQGKRPLRNQKEFFELAEEILIDIGNDLRNGQSDIKALLWDGLKPRKESDVQRVVKEKVAHHRLLRHVIDNREVEISDAKRPDIKLDTVFKNGKKAAIYIEIKRQMHRDLFTSIEKQLVDQYLTQQDIKYGFYFVTWYGSESKFWKNGTPLTKRRSYCNSPINSAAELEICLQKIADDLVAHSDSVGGIKVVVADVSRK